MEQETLFTATKWDILEALTDGKKSPFQLSELCNTSLANVSQQLRLLELGGIVTAERVSNRDKGKPRVLYSLKGDNAFIIATMPGFVKKSMFSLSESQKATMKIWLAVNPAQQAFVEKGFENTKDYLDDIDAIYFDNSSLTNVHLIISSTKESLKTKIKDFSATIGGVKSNIKYSIKSEYQKSSSTIKLYNNKNSGVRGGK